MEEDEEKQTTVEYNDDNIRHLSDMEHVRTRPGMYIGKLATEVIRKMASMCS